jgi:hypothetical protein
MGGCALWNGAKIISHFPLVLFAAIFVAVLGHSAILLCLCGQRLDIREKQLRGNLVTYFRPVPMRLTGGRTDTDTA